MISAAAFCPQAPLLVPDLAAGAAPELDRLRGACRAALRQVVNSGPLVLLGAAERSATHGPAAAGTLAGFGLALSVTLGAGAPDQRGAGAPDQRGAGAPDQRGAGAAAGDGADRPGELPPSLVVGAWLLADALGPVPGVRAFSVGPDFAASPAAAELQQLAATDQVALLVLGDGTARRSASAPGYLDERAAPFDDAVLAAVQGGDPAALAGLDADLGAELLAAGVPAWHAAAGVLDPGGYRAEVLFRDDPYGVLYLVATWTGPRSGPR